MLPCFILDLDGVITDTAQYHYLAWKRLAYEEGLPFSPFFKDRLRGVSRANWYSQKTGGRPSTASRTKESNQ